LSALARERSRLLPAGIAQQAKVFRNPVIQSSPQSETRVSFRAAL